MKSHHRILTWHNIHQILHPKALPRSLGRRKAGRSSENPAPSSFRIHACPYPGRLAYIHGLPLIIAGKRHHSMRYGRPWRDGRRGWVGTGRDSGPAEIDTAKRYVRWQIGTMSRHRGAGRGMYVCMYVHTIVDGTACMCSIHMSLLSCITYLVPGGDVRSLLQKERTGRSMAIIGCMMEGRPLQKQ